MRRIASSLVAACAIATLSACSSGGFGLGTSNNTVPSGAQFTGSDGLTNDFFLAPTASDPIAVTATGYTGSGASEEVVPFATFTWQSGYAPKGTTFVKGPSPNGNTPCGTASETPTVPILQAGNSGTPYGQYGGAFSILSTGHTANTVYVGVPLDPITGAPVLPATGSTNYCLLLEAVNSAGAVVGGVTIVVTNTVT